MISLSKCSEFKEISCVDPVILCNRHPNLSDIFLRNLPCITFETFKMKYIRSIIVILLTTVFLFSCQKKDEIVKFTFLQLNDIYEIGALEGGKVGGMDRVETLHQQLIKENPNTLMFHAGDFLNPSLVGNIKFEGERVKGKQMIGSIIMIMKTKLLIGLGRNFGV